MEGKRHFRLLTTAEREEITNKHDRHIEWQRKAKNATAFPQSTIAAAQSTLNLTINWLNEQWYVVEIK